MNVLSVGRWAAGVDPELLDLAASRCETGAWRSPAARVQLELRRCASALPAGATPLDGIDPEEGGYRFLDGALEVWIPPTPGAADAALRLLFATAFELQGGVLLHAAGISLGGQALLAAGASGAGKSTLAQSCADAGMEILSDETLGVLADGTLWATPFRSSARFLVRDPQAPRALRALVFLEHAPEEHLVSLRAAEAAAGLLRQMYPGPVLKAGERLRRAAALGTAVPSSTFGLRRHPEVATFVRNHLLRPLDGR